jgi:hypothetical protein
VEQCEKKRLCKANKYGALFAFLRNEGPSPTYYFQLTESTISEENCDPAGLYSAIQEERSIFLEVIVWVIVRKNVCMNVCLILNGCKERGV